MLRANVIFDKHNYGSGGILLCLHSNKLWELLRSLLSNFTIMKYVKETSNEDMNIKVHMGYCTHTTHPRLNCASEATQTKQYYSNDRPANTIYYNILQYYIYYVYSPIPFASKGIGLYKGTSPTRNLFKSCKSDCSDALNVYFWMHGIYLEEQSKLPIAAYLLSYSFIVQANTIII